MGALRAQFDALAAQLDAVRAAGDKQRGDDAEALTALRRELSAMTGERDQLLVRSATTTSAAHGELTQLRDALRAAEARAAAAAADAATQVRACDERAERERAEARLAQQRAADALHAEQQRAAGLAQQLLDATAASAALRTEHERANAAHAGQVRRRVAVAPRRSP